MKTVSDDLFRLIRSLNKSEKGFFKKFAAKNASGSKQNYIILFDAIDQMTEYDEEKLRQKLKKESFVKQLPVYKIYLFNLILRSLAPNSLFEDSASKIKEHIENSKILSSKALYREALKQLKKARELSLKYSLYIPLLESLASERNILSVMPDKNISEMRKVIYEQQKETLAKLAKYYEYSWLSDQMVICVEQKGDFTNEEREKEMQNIIRLPLISDDNLPDDINMRNYQIHTRLFYYLGKNDLVKVRELLKIEIRELEHNRHVIDDNPRNYSSALINLLLFSQITGSRKDVLETLTKLNTLRRKLKNKVPLSQQIQINFHAANSEILVYRNSADLRRGRLLVKRMDEEIPKFGAEIPPQLKVSLLSNIASFLTMDGNFDSALKYNNKLLDESGLNFKSDVYLFGKLLNLVIHYGLKNISLLEYSVDNVYKFFRDKNVMHKAESILLNHFKRLLKTSPGEHKELFNELYFNLTRLPGDSSTQNLFAMFDFISWAKAGAHKLSMAEVVKTANSEKKLQ